MERIWIPDGDGGEWLWHTAIVQGSINISIFCTVLYGSIHGTLGMS